VCPPASTQVDAFSYPYFFSSRSVLAILCGTALGLKIHNPTKGSPVLANKLTGVRWERTQDSDPTSVSFLMENLVGEEKKLVPGGPYNASQGEKDTTSQMSFPDVGCVP
jgi:hypothetical protein